jgi:hypothetical protein
MRPKVWGIFSAFYLAFSSSSPSRVHVVEYIYLPSCSSAHILRIRKDGPEPDILDQGFFQTSLTSCSVAAEYISRNTNATRI